MRKWLVSILGFLSLAIWPGLTFGQWDPTKPADNTAALTSDVRANWIAIAETLGSVNLLADPTFLIWQAGDSVVPAHWSISGTGAAIARTGTGLADTTRKVGDFAAKVTSGPDVGVGNTLFAQQLLPTAAFTKANYLQGEPISCGVWLKASDAGDAVGVRIYDGVGYSATSHTGSGDWEWVTVTRTLDASATELTFQISVLAQSISAYVSGPTCLLGPVVPKAFQPAPVVYAEKEFFISGAISAAAGQRRLQVNRPIIIDFVQLWILTAPTGQALIVDVDTWDGASFTSMFSASGAQPQIAATASRGGAAPDSTYARRCMTYSSGSGAVTGGILQIDIDQVGSGTAGSNLVVQIRYRMYARPLATFLGYSDVY